jgi:predicted Zn-dependent protease
VGGGPAPALAALLLAAGCAVNPVSGQRELILVSEEQERAAGREGAEQVAAHMGILAAPELAAYVAAVGARVAERSPRAGVEWRFEVVDQEVPNAFALPDGHIYVSRGLIELANSEDEVAAVLAHEVVHVAARHHAQRQTRAAGAGLLALPGSIAGSVLGGPLGELVQAPMIAIGAGIVASYSRDQEREADRVGQRLAAEAGYEPAALASQLETLARWTREHARRADEPGFFDSHPSAPERAADARAHAGILPGQPRPGVAPDRAAFLGRLEGLLVGANPAEGLLVDGRFVHPDLLFSLRFPEGWRTANARSAVAAWSPDERASLVLELEARGEDPGAAAAATLEASSRQTPLAVLRSGALEIGGLPAYRAEVAAGRARSFLHLTWIAYRGLIYLVAGVVDETDAASRRRSFEEASASFRPLAPEERAAIREHRLRLARAQAGESLAALVRRAGSSWDVGYVALANALAPDVSLAQGALVKIAVPAPYAGRPG